jgi:surface polysaccharide O-acyltransferase-like enzyme
MMLIFILMLIKSTKLPEVYVNKLKNMQENYEKIYIIHPVDFYHVGIC